MKALFITPWYPSKYDAMSGLFVFRHAEAILTQDIDVHVLYVCYHKDVEAPYIEHVWSEGVEQTYFYFPENEYFSIIVFKFLISDFK